MAANAQVPTTTVIVDASPDHGANIAIATLSSVNVDPYGSNVRLIGMVSLTPGADTTGVTLQLRRNGATGQQIGIDIVVSVTPAVPTVVNAFGARSEPTGQHAYSIYLAQAGASADAVINAVTLIGIVGN